MRSSWLLWWLGGGALVLGACQLLANIDDRTIWDGGVADVAQNDTGVDPCAQPNVPHAPDISTSSTSDNVTITAALSKVMLGETDGGPYYGFNLDSKCTCPNTDSCQRPTSTPTACDDEGGIDNYARRIFEQLNALSPDGGLINESNFNNAVTVGFSGALIQVSKYNGKADDGEVTVTVYGSQGYAGYPTTHPALDGGDVWILDPSSAAGQFSTPYAYVANYTLVAALSFPIIVGSTFTQAVTIELQDGEITATLEMNGNNLVKMTNGTLGGRWDPAKFLPSLQDVPDPLSTDGGHLCGTDFTYELLKKIICENVDINISQSQDNQGICNAVSMGLGFEAMPAKLGDAGAVLNPPTPCGATWKDQCP